MIGSSSTAAASLLTLSGAGSSTFAGTIQDTLGGGTQTVGLGLAAGALTLTGANTFSGPTTVNAGATLRLGAASALYSGTGKGNLTVNGTLDLGGNSLAVAGLSGAGTLSSSVPGTMTLTVGHGDATSTFSGAIKNDNGTVALVKTGAGSLGLGGANAYAGGTIISSGSVVALNNGALGSGTVTLGDASTGASDVALLINNTRGLSNAIIVSSDGTGAATIGHDQGGGPGYSAYYGSITLHRDVVLDSGNQLDRLNFTGVISGTGNVTVVGGHRITLNNNNTFVGNVAVRGAGTILQTYNDNGALPTDTIPNGSGVDVGDGAIFQIYTDEAINALTGAGTVRPIARNPILTLGAGNGDGAFDGAIMDAANRLAIVKAGTRTQTLNGFNTYSGDTTIVDGTLRTPAGLGLPALSRLVFLSNGTTTPVYETSGEFTRSIGAGAGNVTLQGGPCGFSANGGPLIVAIGGMETPVTFTVGTDYANGTDVNVSNLILNQATADGTVELKNSWDLGGGTRTIAVNSTAAGAEATLSGSLSNGSFVKAGPGTLVLSGANSHSGTTVNAGTLAISALSALPAGKSLTIGAGGAVVLSSGLSVGAGAGGGHAAAAPVPEPGTLALLAAGLAVVLLAAWRRRSVFPI